MASVDIAASQPLEADEIPASRKPPSIAKQLVSNHLSQAGFILLTFFTLVAIFAPVLAPPLPNTRDPMLIPRDGFNAVPQPPGIAWDRNPPPLPFWWQAVTGLDHWTHPFGLASGWDIYYGVVWGTRTAFITGIVITVITLVIG